MISVINSINCKMLKSFYNTCPVRGKDTNSTWFLEELRFYVFTTLVYTLELTLYSEGTYSKD